MKTPGVQRPVFWFICVFCRDPCFRVGQGGLSLFCPPLLHSLIVLFNLVPDSVDTIQRLKRHHLRSSRIPNLSPECGPGSGEPVSWREEHGEW